MKYQKIIFVFFILLYSRISAQDTFSPFQNWQFSEVGDTSWNPAIVPGTVHTDLYANKLIPDPFYGLNEYELQWIEKRIGSTVVFLMFPQK